jgi:hypothetical protein
MLIIDLKFVFSPNTVGNCGPPGFMLFFSALEFFIWDSDVEGAGAAGVAVAPSRVSCGGNFSLAKACDTPYLSRPFVPPGGGSAEGPSEYRPSTLPGVPGMPEGASAF